MKIGFIGVGKMAEAIIASLKTCSPGSHQIYACDVDEERRMLMKRRYAINMYTHSLSVMESSDIVFIAVKPQNMDSVLIEIAPCLNKKHLIISIAAGKTIASLEAYLGRAKIVRVMPNLATIVAEGMSVFCAAPSVTAADRKKVDGLLSCFGKVLELPEDKFDVVTALSGSGPAFFSYLLNVMVDVAVREGLSRPDALLLAEQTMFGTSKLLLEKGMDPVDLIESVTSAKGTTAAGMEELKDKELANILGRTIKAAAKRSKQLSK